jgi:hypothetical protein
MTPELLQGPQYLTGLTVFLSASKPSRLLPFLPPDHGPARETVREIEEASLSLARAVFAHGGRLVFGAHPSISPLIATAAAEYFPPAWNNQADRRIPAEIYQSKAFADVVPEATKALARFGYTNLTDVDAVDGERFSPALRGQEQCLKSLAAMRGRMFAETGPSAMVAIGGMEGVIREARLFLQMFEGPVYALRSTGGVSRHLIYCIAENVLMGDRPLRAPDWRARLHVVEDEFQFSGWSNAEGRREELPMVPYALLMQRLVERIGEGE